MSTKEAMAGGFRSLHQDLTWRLREWAAPDDAQDMLRVEFLEHLARHPDAMSKSGPTSHFTASTLVVNTSHDAVLLTHHRRAALWFQFGGHCEATDADVLAAATREAQEESGIPLVVEPDIVQLSRHVLHGDFQRCHEHLDIRFVAQVTDEAQPLVCEESFDVQWFPVAGLPADAGEDLPGLIELAIAQLHS